MPEALCVCGHLAEHHADPASGDTRCLAVEDRRDLLDVFDDGRDGPVALLRAAWPTGGRDPSATTGERPKMSAMTDRDQALATMLGSMRLENAEPSPEMIALAEQWARGELSTAELEQAAQRAAAGQPLTQPAQTAA